ncbi:hypothetical protein TSUD_329000 [Trifolium subterraneum]|uniref:Disease resistance protein At4g27190-like leucine-rich repeats domain-containing protein n=1 Tax=Trifolium subterraneum TaxID=3900 RepID=A0A2Z6MFQ2_TRISU|nr:hypothetical protein TSUD_329000 [Trifolium subterraneum]
MSGLKHLQKLEVRDCQNMEAIIEASSSKIVFHALQHLVLIELPNLKAFSQCHNNLDFPSLQKVEIEDCPNMEVFSRGFSDTPKLEDLSIKIESANNNYIHIQDIVASQGFKMFNWTKKRDATIHYQLQKTTMDDLPKLSHIWKHNIMKVVSFQNLKVEKCEIMEEIITKEEEYIAGGTRVKTLFPKLEELKLLNLPKLECVCSANYDYDLPLCTFGEDSEINNMYDYSIMVSSMEECLNMGTFPHGSVIVNTPNLHNLNLNLDWIDALHGDLNLTIYYLQNSEKFKVELQKSETFKDIDKKLLGYIKGVTNLEIVNCHKLRKCIPSNMMHLFSHLEKLEVGECDFLEEIFESNDYMLECELEDLNLFSLPKLKHIWKNHSQILGFKDLQCIIVKQCNYLEYVFPDVSMITSLPYLFKIVVCECEKMKEIVGNNCYPLNCVQQKAKKIKFPSLGKIHLENLPNLKCFSQSSFPSYVELPMCYKIRIKDCPELKTFWDDGIVCTIKYFILSMDDSDFFDKLDVNEFIQQYMNGKRRQVLV